MAKPRKKHSELPPEQRYKANTRSYANVYKRRGWIEPKGCEVCAGPAQMHHDDYDAPLKVRWFCRDHHLELHKNERAFTNVSRETLTISSIRMRHFGG